MLIIVGYSKKEAKKDLLKYGDIIFESNFFNILFLELKNNKLDKNILLAIDGIDTVEEDCVYKVLSSDIKFYAYVNGIKKNGSLQEVYDFYNQEPNDRYKAIGVDYINPYSEMDSSIDILITRDGIQKISEDYINLKLKSKLENAVVLIKDFLESKKSS